MAILCDVAPLAAMELLYHGETNGVWQGDFIKNEQKRALILPELLREFLHRYGYLPVNRGDGHLYHPDEIVPFTLNTADGALHLWAIGWCLTDKAVAIKAGWQVEDPFVYLGQTGEDGVTDWNSTNTRLSDVLKLLFCFNLLGPQGGELITESDSVTFLCQQFQLPDYCLTVEKNHLSTHIYWDEQNHVCLVTIPALQAVALLPQARNQAAEKEGYSALSLEELEQLFNKEFYQNSLHCDYAHALALLLEMIARMEKALADSVQLAEKYQLAGRCCWALEQWEQALVWYEKAAPIREMQQAELPVETCQYYIALGNFYFSCGKQAESVAMYQKAETICRQYAPQNYYQLGRIFQVQGENWSKLEGQYEHAIDFYNLALEEFQKAPKDCKYDIARCQQLRGEMKRKKKEAMKRK